MTTISDLLLAQWQDVRCLTYDYLDLLDESQLTAKLPFARSQSLGYQFWCMAGAHESYLRKLEQGSWQGFSCSLGGFDPVTPAIIAQQMLAADAKMNALLAQISLDDRLDNGQPGYEVVMQMLKHEMHHHGQLINFLYCFEWPIPDSWADEWALAYD